MLCFSRYWVNAIFPLRRGAHPVDSAAGRSFVKAVEQVSLPRLEREVKLQCPEPWFTNCRLWRRKIEPTFHIGHVVQSTTRRHKLVQGDRHLLPLGQFEELQVTLLPDGHLVLTKLLRQTFLLQVHVPPLLVDAGRENSDMTPVDLPNKSDNKGDQQKSLYGFSEAEHARGVCRWSVFQQPRGTPRRLCWRPSCGKSLPGEQDNAER